MSALCWILVDSRRCNNAFKMMSVQCQCEMLLQRWIMIVMVEHFILRWQIVDTMLVWRPRPWRMKTILAQHRCAIWEAHIYIFFYLNKTTNKSGVVLYHAEDKCSEFSFQLWYFHLDRRAWLAFSNIYIYF